MRTLPLLLAAALMAAPFVAADALGEAADDPAGSALGVAERARDAAVDTAADPGATLQDPWGTVMPVLHPPAEEAPPPPADEPPAFADRMAQAFAAGLLPVGVAGTFLAGLVLAGFALVTRYVSPKEALQNPQRAMLYGYVRGHPGVHLKELSDEFAMKTSSILWHMRKLEAAELVRSERANGFRVFYPVAGGIEVRRVSRALTTLRNANAARVFEVLDGRPGATVRQLADRTAINGGTVRWHLRKLRDHGLVEELVRDDGSRFYPTPLGRKTLEALQGAPVTTSRRTPSGHPVPE